MEYESKQTGTNDKLEFSQPTELKSRDDVLHLQQRGTSKPSWTGRRVASPVCRIIHAHYQIIDTVATIGWTSSGYTCRADQRAYHH